ncbi:AI-2E family transporter [Caulobacter sp. 17J80-11]|uniref:AI-2E family transporter n=1 Tax=Caulobacter sp. 17J80-11 TaxID=2763502 RepID=UPI0016537ABD|nr:AI-2E family transporter [Caulobacter sp. 17J80-11]MBC6980443.1 AI-2E family transporter [Caulobacter sp. 17J80-11]
MSDAAKPDRRGLDPAFVRRVLFVFGVAIALLVAWRLLHVLLLLFGASLVAVLLHAIADPIEERTPLTRKWSLTVAVLAVVAVIGAAGWLFGREVGAQVSILSARLPAAWAEVRARADEIPLGRQMVERLDHWAGQTAEPAAPPEGEAEPGPPTDTGALRLPDVGGGVVSGVTNAVGSAVGAVVDLIVVLAAGLYLAAAPGHYRRGALFLVPRSHRERAGEVFDITAQGLKRWLIGTLFCMAVVGVLTAVGAWAIGLPSPLALGLIAGLLEFVPLIGPTLSVVPGVLLALNLGMETVLWTLAVYIGVQQLESNLIVPIVQRRMVALPPVITLFAVIAFAVLLGPIGVVLATPLAATIFVAVKALYPPED